MQEAQIFKGEDNTALRFYFDSAKNNAATEKFGRPLYDKILMVEVITPGAKESSPTFELERTFCEDMGIEKPRRSPQYDKYKPQIELFLNGDAGGDRSGTPLKEWPQCDVHLVATLAEARIYTVEALAAVPDSNLGAIGMGARKLRDQAQAWLATAKGGEQTAALVSRVSDLTEENALLKNSLKQMQDRLAALESNSAPATPPEPPVAPAPAPVTPPATNRRGTAAQPSVVLQDIV